MRIFSKNKRSDETRTIMMSLYLNSKNKENSKRIYTKERKEEKKKRKEKYEMINATVYELNDLAYLIV